MCAGPRINVPVDLLKGPGPSDRQRARRGWRRSGRIGPYRFFFVSLLIFHSRFVFSEIKKKSNRNNVPRARDKHNDLGTPKVRYNDNTNNSTEVTITTTAGACACTK